MPTRHRSRHLPLRPNRRVRRPFRGICASRDTRESIFSPFQPPTVVVDLTDRDRRFRRGFVSNRLIEILPLAISSRRYTLSTMIRLSWRKGQIRFLLYCAIDRISIARDYPSRAGVFGLERLRESATRRRTVSPPSSYFISAK